MTDQVVRKILREFAYSIGGQFAGPLVHGLLRTAVRMQSMHQVYFDPEQLAAWIE